MMFEVISPTTLPSFSNRLISSRNWAKNPSWTCCARAATPGEVGVAANARTACSTPPSSTMG